MNRFWFGLGALSGFVAVAMAAFTAHGMAPEAQRIAASGVQMQGWHALALLGVGLWAPRGGRWTDAAGACFGLGTLLFCGGVYPLALWGARTGGIAPIGGTLLMVGWLLLIVAAWRGR